MEILWSSSHTSRQAECDQCFLPSSPFARWIVRIAYSWSCLYMENLLVVLKDYRKTEALTEASELSLKPLIVKWYFITLQLHNFHFISKNIKILITLQNERNTKFLAVCYDIQYHHGLAISFLKIIPNYGHPVLMKEI